MFFVFWDIFYIFILGGISLQVGYGKAHRARQGNVGDYYFIEETRTTFRAEKFETLENSFHDHTKSPR